MTVKTIYNGCVADYRQGLPGIDNQLSNLGNSSLSEGFAKLAPSEIPITPSGIICLQAVLTCLVGLWTMFQEQRATVRLWQHGKDYSQAGQI